MGDYSCSSAGEYRDAERAEGCDAIKTCARTNSARRFMGKTERSVKGHVPNLGKYRGKFESSRQMRLRDSERNNVSDERQAKLATEVGVNIVVGYEQRRTGATPGGKYACFECGNTSHFMEGFPVFNDKWKV